MKIVTYRSQNAPTGKEWMAYILLENEYLPVRFNGCTEDEAVELAKNEWDRHEEERERNIAAREEGRRKAAETRARKKATEE